MRRSVLLFMRLCGHDCVVRGRYDPGSAGSGRYFYRLDPQDPLNFGRNLLSLLLTLASGRSPLAGVRFCGWHTFGTPTARICNARVCPIVYLTTSVRDHLTNWHKRGRQGGGLGSTLVSTKRGRRNATAQPCWLPLDIDSLCLVHSQPFTHHNQCFPVSCHG